jgi:hypothetical protein
VIEIPPGQRDVKADQMLLGLLLAGMALGAVAAGTWGLAGGSLLIALALYSLVATLFVLGAAVLTFLLSLRRGGADGDGGGTTVLPGRPLASPLHDDTGLRARVPDP